MFVIGHACVLLMMFSLASNQVPLSDEQRNETDVFILDWTDEISNVDSKGTYVCQDSNTQSLMDIMERTQCNRERGEVPVWLYINNHPVITGYIRTCSHHLGYRRNPCRRLLAIFERCIFIESTKTNNLPLHVNGESVNDGWRLKQKAWITAYEIKLKITQINVITIE